MSTMPTHAIVLAAGLGTRMRPLTLTKPKPLIEVAGKPLIDWCLDWLAQAHIQQVVVNTSYMAQMLEEYLAARVSPQVHISREEPQPLETGGGIAKALHLLGDAPFVAMNSDAIFSGHTTHPITQLAKRWDNTTMDFCMALAHKNQVRGWQGNGDFIRDDAGFIRRPLEGEAAEYVFTGVEIIHPRVFTGCLQGAFSLNSLWKKSLQPNGVYAQIQSVVIEGEWLNVGDLEGLREAEKLLRR